MMRSVLFLATGAFVAFVGGVLIVAPESYLRIYAVNYDPGMDFAATRFAPALIGLGVLLIAARGLTDLRFLRLLSLLCAAVFLGVAATGVAAWATETARPTILIAAATEGVAAALFAWSALHKDDAK